MKTFRGTIKLQDIEGGIWVIETEEGEVYQLYGSEEIYKDGKKVTITGEVAEDIMTIGMMAPVLKIKDIR